MFQLCNVLDNQNQQNLKWNKNKQKIAIAWLNVQEYKVVGDYVQSDGG